MTCAPVVQSARVIDAFFREVVVGSATRWAGPASADLVHGIFLVSLSGHIFTMPLEAGELILKLRNGARPPPPPAGGAWK